MLANAGISVRNRVVGFESSKVTSFLNVPWMSVPLDVISSTLPVFTCCRKNGLYGTRTRDAGSIALLVTNRSSASSATKKMTQRRENGNQGRRGGGEISLCSRRSRGAIVRLAEPSL